MASMSRTVNITGLYAHHIAPGTWIDGASGLGVSLRKIGGFDATGAFELLVFDGKNRIIGG